MDNKFSFIAIDLDNDFRIDSVISNRFPDKSRNSIQKLIEKQQILVNEKIINKNYKVKTGDEITMFIPEPVILDIIPQDIEIDIVFEDNDLIIVNKPKGMVVHPAVGNYEKTLVNALLFHCKDSLSGINGELRPGIVHRIDKDTSGLLIVAKNDFSHNILAEQIKQHSFKREYEAIVHGVIKQDNLTIDLPIGRHPIDRKKMTVTPKNSRNAVTELQVLKRYNGFTHIRLMLKTGRTHQIRVHLSHLGFPVAGDAVYGVKKYITELKGQCLHAKSIGFVHPRTNEYLGFESELPDYFKKFLNKLENK